MAAGWIRASIASAIAQLTRMFCGLAVLKIVVMQLGVEGIGKLGHFMNLLSILFVFAGGGINVGIAKYVAQYENSKAQLDEFLSAAWTYSLLASCVLAVVFVAGAHAASVLLFGDSQYQRLIIFVGLAQFAFAYINFVTGVVNGLRQTQAFSRILTIGSLIGIIPCYFLVSAYQLSGAVVALVLVQAGMLIPATRELGKLIKLRPRFTARLGETGKLGQFSLMQLSSVATMPLVEMYIRTELARIVGWEGAGTWQGVQRLSYAALSLFISFLSVYYMPTLSALTDGRKIVSYVVKTLGGVLLVFGFAAMSIYFLRGLVFSILLSKDFFIAPDLLRYQLVGDFFRIGAYVIGFLAVAKAATKLYVIGELVQSGFYVVSFLIASHLAGGRGVFIAYALSNFCYFLVCFAGLAFYARARLRAAT
ncbi:Lipid III flippase [Paraburkholderia domus]|uniref:O-antigen translocase n=1 Tax=Paraburkholderia domus TaxID=2793075 RepID=UPI0019139BD0|nr:O-antigen translocase [Paraburkholderia domus]MBK5052539.1 O-antigen translocase [Burkholderia sp. R-70006]CAE6811933.1 Lipid III flippase [Paraburkholderia domus]CAE6889068.1 Lipid III flippase [Paraburkholderia domus]